MAGSCGGLLRLGRLLDVLVHKGDARAEFGSGVVERVFDVGYVLGPGMELPAGSVVLVGEVMWWGEYEPRAVLGSGCRPREAGVPDDWAASRVSEIRPERLMEWFRDHGWTEVSDDQWRLLLPDGGCETWIVGSTEASVENVRRLAGLAGCSFTSCLESLVRQSHGSSELPRR